MTNKRSIFLVTEKQCLCIVIISLLPVLNRTDVKSKRHGNDTA